MALPIIKFSPNTFDHDIFNYYFDYFKSEKECLKHMKKVLTSNKELLSSSIGKYSTCGIFTCTIGTFHLENQKRLTKAVDLTKLLNQGIGVSIDMEQIIPENYELVKKIGTAFKNEINIKKR